MVGILWLIAAKYDIDLISHRVPSNKNVSDGVSRIKDSEAFNALPEQIHELGLPHESFSCELLTYPQFMDQLPKVELGTTFQFPKVFYH